MVKLILQKMNGNVKKQHLFEENKENDIVGVGKSFVTYLNFMA